MERWVSVIQNLYCVHGYLQEELATLNLNGLSGQFNKNDCAPTVNGSAEHDEKHWRKAKVVCDYEATTRDELSLKILR